MSSFERDPAKRKVKPVESAQSLLDFDLGESSDDSDFRIEDHAAEETDDDSGNTDDDQNKNGRKSSSSEDLSDLDDAKIKNSTNKYTQDLSITELLERAKRQQDFKFPGNIADMLICAGCLGSRSDDWNEIVECDGCGVTVHEGCYGVSDVTSESSTVSSASTEPWFCEACKAGVTDPTCELCPNKGGIFKETEVGAWVHLVCALYVPGVAFSEVERLSGVTLFEMAYSRWGARSCALCSDARLARAGVCVGCDAGLCKTFFHVTCGQREGLLAEAHSEEVEQADPFYAHCRMHSDKTLVKKRKRNWLAFQLRTEKRKHELRNRIDEIAKVRIQRKLIKYRRKYLAQKELRNPPWVPTQKMARMLFSSASAMRKFARKAECMGIDTHALELQDSQMAALKDVSRRWHIPPAFSVEFVGYYLERNSRVATLRRALETLSTDNEKFLGENEKLREQYDQAARGNSDALSKMKETSTSLQRLYNAILVLCPSKTLPTMLEEKPLLPPVLNKSTPKVTPQQLQSRSMSVPTAAALKMGVGFPLSNRPETQHGKVLSTSLEAGALAPRECAICARSSEQHLMAGCDTCKRHYHLHCLRPPLQRMPKKSKLYGWQCSECDKTSESEPEVMEKKVPRRSRTRYSKDGTIISASEPLSSDTPNSPTAKKQPKEKLASPEPKLKLTVANLKTPENITLSPIKVTIKPIEFSKDAKKELKKLNKQKSLDQSVSAGETNESPNKKSRKRSFTSPTLTNTPLMSITPIVAESPHDSHNENSNGSNAAAASKLTEDSSFLSANSSFSTLLGSSDKERENKAMKSSIESTLANLTSDIASYKANRKRRKEKHRSRYSPDLLRSPSKHKHKRKKKMQDVENPNPHPRITIKIKPIPKPAGSVDPQLFYVPTDSNDGPPPVVVLKKHIPLLIEKPSASAESAVVTTETEQPGSVTSTATASERQTARAERARRGADGARVAPAQLPALVICDVCTNPGDKDNLVRCDECYKRYHFTCLEPPLNKNPKKRGYSWHCADCDPTDQEDNN